MNKRCVLCGRLIHLILILLDHFWLQCDLVISLCINFTGAVTLQVFMPAVWDAVIYC